MAEELENELTGGAGSFGVVHQIEMHDEGSSGRDVLLGCFRRANGHTPSSDGTQGVESTVVTA